MKVYHGAGLSIWGQSEYTEQLWQSDHLQLSVPMMLVVSPTPGTQVTPNSASWGIHGWKNRLSNIQFEHILVSKFVLIIFSETAAESSKTLFLFFFSPFFLERKAIYKLYISSQTKKLVWFYECMVNTVSQ